MSSRHLHRKVVLTDKWSQWTSSAPKSKVSANHLTILLKTQVLILAAQGGA